MIEEAGFRYAPPSLVPNSRRALELGELARARGRFAELHPRLFSAYWSEGRDIGDPETLLALGADAGLDPAEVRAVIEEGRYAGEIRAATGIAVQLGIDGVPAWLIEGRRLVPGAQPLDVFERVMHRLGYGPRGAAASAG